MNHLNLFEVASAAKIDATLAASIKHLDQFGVIGITSAYEFKRTTDYLKSRLSSLVAIDWNQSKGLIWCTSVGEILDRQFSGQLKPKIQKTISWPKNWKPSEDGGAI